MQIIELGKIDYQYLIKTLNKHSKKDMVLKSITKKIKERTSRMKIVKANELKGKGTLNVLIYGPPGIGKTTMAGSAPKPLYIDIEGGTLSIMDKDIDIAQCENAKEVMDAVKYATESGYKTVVIDSLTKYCAWYMDMVLMQAGRKNPQIQDWGVVSKHIKEFSERLRKKDINVIFICLEKEDKDEELGIVMKRPALSGQLQQIIPGDMDVCGYLHSNHKGTRLLSVNPCNRWYAKHRLPLEKAIKEDIEPTWDVLASHWFEKEGK